MPQPTRARRPVVMISSTVQELTDCRREATEACERIGMRPEVMEHLPAVDATPVTASMRMVDEADIYVGIYANRYGHQPPGYEHSITEMEYDRAVQRGIPRFIFMTREDAGGDAEDGDAAAGRLEEFKARLRAERHAGQIRAGFVRSRR